MSRSVWQMMIADSSLPARQRHLLLVVSLYAEDRLAANSPWPTSNQIADDMNVTIVTVWNHLAQLREAGWLVRVPAHPPRYKPALRADQMRLMMDAS